MAGVASAAVEEEWELCNDDGFIYKRRKRGNPDDGPPLASSSVHPPAAESETELKRNRLARKKLSLLALRDRYRREIELWEGLVASLQNGGRSGSDGDGGGSGAARLHPSVEDPACEPGAATGAASSTCDQREPYGVTAPENTFHALVEELVLQVEAQDMILKKLSDICDIVDSACDMREEAIMESLLNLPVWGSPRSLMASLAD